MAIKRCWAIFHNNPKIVAEGRQGYSIKKGEGIDFIYLSEQEATEDAQALASQHPGTTVVILEAKSVLEAKKPETTAKSWKENGELIPIELKIAKKTLYVDPLERQLADAARIDVHVDNPYLEPAPAEGEANRGVIPPVGGINWGAGLAQQGENQVRPIPPVRRPRG